MTEQTPGGVAPDGCKLIGVARAVQHSQIESMPDGQQDSLIRDVLALCQADLKTMVGGVQPLGPLAGTVTGPHSDTILGPIHTLTVAGYFRIADLPSDCQAYVLHVTGGIDGNGLDVKDGTDG